MNIHYGRVANTFSVKCSLGRYARVPHGLKVMACVVIIDRETLFHDYFSPCVNYNNSLGLQLINVLAFGASSRLETGEKPSIITLCFNFSCPLCLGPLASRLTAFINNGSLPETCSLPFVSKFWDSCLLQLRLFVGKPYCSMIYAKRIHCSRNLANIR